MAGRSVFPVAQGFPNSSTCSRVVLLGSKDVSFFVRPIVAPLQAIDIRPGNSSRRQLGSCLAATAAVLDVRSDLLGIPHVQFSVTVSGSATRLSEGDIRVLALQSLLDTYRERLAQEA